MPQVQGGRAGQAPPMTKCAIESTSRSTSHRQVDRRVRPIPLYRRGRVRRSTARTVPRIRRVRVVSPVPAVLASRRLKICDAAACRPSGADQASGCLASPDSMSLASGAVASQ